MKTRARIAAFPRSKPPDPGDITDDAGDMLARSSREVHIGCGGTVVLDHEVWRCKKCRRAPIPIADTKTIYE